MSYPFKFNHRAYMCMATITGDFTVVTDLSEEDTERWLKFVQSQEHFDYKIDGDEVHVHLKSYDYCYRVMMGSFLKGLNEHSKWLFPLINEEPEKDFFLKAYKRFMEFFEKDKPWVSAQIHGHHWFNYGFDYERGWQVKSKEPKTKTISELFAKYKEKPEQRPMWAYYLGV